LYKNITLKGDFDMGYTYYTKSYYSTVCHIMEFDPREFRLDVTLGVRGKLETLPKIAGQPKDNEKVIAKMNASFFGMDGKSGDTYSTFVDEGLYYSPSAPGYPTLIFWKDYTMTIEHNPTQDRLAYYQEHAFFAIGIGWTLIVDGKVDYTYDKAKLIELFGHPYQRNPRTMIGQKYDGTIVMVVTNGRGTGSSGLTTVHESDIMKALGCKVAVNMDGGGSSELYIDGKTMNTLQGNYHRPIGTAFVVYGPKDNAQISIKSPDITYSPTKSGTVTANSLNVRTGAGTNYSAIGELSKGTPVTIIGANSTGKWYYIKSNSVSVGWVSATYISLNNTTISNAPSSSTSSLTKTTTAALRIRSNRNILGKTLAVIPKGTKVAVSDLKSGWYKVTYNGVTGYSSATYLK
jgi:uncharacterized protein YraI